ncbi:MAG: DUF6134 family protein [Planctomycetales bacterium]
MVNLRSLRPLSVAIFVSLLSCPMLFGVEPAGQQRREFEILVDGNPMGTYRMKISDTQEQSVMELNADVKANILFYTYMYQFRGKEVWQDGKLSRVDSQTLDDGKPIRTSATIKDDKTQILINGERREGQGAHFTSSYWKLPEKYIRQRDKATQVYILDPDDGVAKKATLTYVRAENLRLRNGDQTSMRFRLTGEVDVHLWYDTQGLLLRQSFEEQGHLTDIRLTGVFKEGTRDAPRVGAVEDMFDMK